MNYLPHIRQVVLTGRGGSTYWGLLEEAVTAMTPHQQEALYRVLSNTKDEAVMEAKREVRKAPWRYMGS